MFVINYHPQRSCGKVMFLHLSVILFTGGWQTPLGRHPPGRHPLCSAYWEIRATSGRYTSYWNAYLFFDRFCLFFAYFLFSLPLLLYVIRPLRCVHNGPIYIRSKIMQIVYCKRVFLHIQKYIVCQH